MADFTRWGYAIAEALGLGGKRFLTAYFNNQNKSNEEAVSAHPVAATVLALMKGRHKYKGTVAELLKDLELIALKEKINVHVPSFPKAAHMLSRRLKEVKSNLKQLGIVYDIRHAGDAKVVRIEKLRSAKLNNEDKPNNLNDITLPRKQLQLSTKEWIDLRDPIEDEI
ncbi:hypothetical protein HPY28_19345 [Brevibacillus sp. HB1.2]|uniref:hypothetical protein n=1 Tax=Brevibacillus sp. HB1.2 TaxID=2738807 RepID=UPI00157542E6|nr:hypothetical protein [Brevibacillus sp. HB1.2]NTU22481.1 hypothetical protein [Brevibacillus sp. HB1.2]